jgi:uncharacterized protein (DUF1800 family)
MSQRRPLPRDVATAVRRFGLGPKPGDIARIAADPRGYVLSALATPQLARIDDSSELQPTPAVLAALEDARIERATMRASQSVADAAPGMPAAPPPVALAKPSGAQPVARLRREALREEAFARITRAVQTDTPMLERLVYFWSNHFCVSVTKGQVRALAGAFEREAIRPHILGRFSDMLSAVEHHPGMLMFLDNVQSIGPNSKAGLGRDKGLNENLAREILELHTVSVDGGYTQADVTNFANIITGWTFGHGEKVAEADKGHFMFTPNRHEPGAFSVLGKTYDQPGRASGAAVLADLAVHPATARHIARKLARHFVSDNPPPALVARLEKTFRDTGGDLAAVTRALVDSPEAWDAQPAKIVPPFEFAVSLARGFALKNAPPPEINRLAAVLGQPLWQVPSPQGWPDADNSWMGPSPIRERLRIAEKVAREIDRAADPRLVLADLAGPGVSEYTRQAVQRAETREQAFELMIMSPDFMRR